MGISKLGTVGIPGTEGREGALGKPEIPGNAIPGKLGNDMFPTEKNGKLGIPGTLGTDGTLGNAGTEGNETPGNMKFPHLDVMAT